MQQTIDSRSERFTASLVILSLVAGLIITSMVASIPLAQMPVSPDQWWMWCWTGLGAWYGLTAHFIRTPVARFIPLPLAGAAAFAVAQIFTVLLFDATMIALPYYLAPIVPFALFGGIGLGLFSCFIKKCASIWSFILIGGLSFGIGNGIDFLIRDAIIIPNIDQLSASAISSLKLIALLCFSLCAGAGSFIALRRR